MVYTKLGWRHWGGPHDVTSWDFKENQQQGVTNLYFKLDGLFSDSIRDGILQVSREKNVDGVKMWKQMPYFTTTLAQDETFYFIQPDDEVFDDQELEDEIEEYKQKLKRSEKEKDDQEQRADEAEEMNRKLKKEVCQTRVSP